jgi:hypothetical protein
MQSLVTPSRQSFTSHEEVTGMRSKHAPRISLRTVGLSFSVAFASLTAVGDDDDLGWG